MRRAVLLVLALAALVGATTRTAHAAPLAVGIDDERLMFTSPVTASNAVTDWSGLGVRKVRLLARWGTIAPAGKGAKAPKGFNGANPNDRHYRWAALDTAIGLIHGMGMDVMLTITGPGPLWSSRAPSHRRPSWLPSPKQFGRFVTAVAKRYGSQVDEYMIWNEPNLMPFLMPQNHCIRPRVCSPVSPHTYRDLFNAAAPAIHRADPGSRVFFGELAPTGRPALSDGTRESPLPFLRALGCVDSRLRSIRSGLCRHFKPIVADGFAYHPHPGSTPPDGHATSSEDAKFGDLPHLFSVLNKLTSKRRLRVTRGKRFPVYLTEFGYQTNPPDKALGIPVAKQLAYLQQASYLAWKMSQVKVLTFYQYEDEAIKRRRSGGHWVYYGWQSGLRYINGKPKPVFSTFPAPFVVDWKPGQRTGTLWGQVRPPHDPTITVQVRPHGSKTWQDLMVLTPGSDGGWLRKVSITASASYRYQWTPAATLDDPTPSPKASGIVDLSKRATDSMRASAALAGSG